MNDDIDIQDDTGPFFDTLVERVLDAETEVLITREDAQVIVNTILGSTIIEHGIVWAESKGEAHIYKREDMCIGILHKYGQPGDERVARLSSGWVRKESL